MKPTDAENRTLSQSESQGAGRQSLGRKGYGKPGADPVVGSDEPEQPARRPGQPGSVDEPDRPGPGPESLHPTGAHPPFARDVDSKD